jgi:hypothetical protein
MNVSRTLMSEVGAGEIERCSSVESDVPAKAM